MSATNASQLVAYLSGANVDAPDWAGLVEAAGETLTIGILADRALDREAGLSEPIRDLLEAVRDRATKRNALIRRQFAELLGPLNAIGVQPIPMKGVARLLRSDANDCRLLSDIDIMIPANRRGECADALKRTLGYTPTEEDADHAPVVLSRESDAGSVDLHTQLKPKYLGLAYAEVVALCGSADLGSGTFMMPSPTCEALMLIAHDQLHDADYWRGLVDVRHALDLREIVEEGVDWPLLAGFFPVGSCRRALEVGLLTARSFVGAHVPQSQCGGAWAHLQVKRRRLQSRFPGLRHLLTLVAIATDPPMLEASACADERAKEKPREKLNRRLTTYLRPTNPGKISWGVPLSTSRRGRPRASFRLETDGEACAPADR